jgi:hypothetical protein
MASWIGTKILVFFINYIVIKLFLKSTKEVLSVEEVWHSPNMLSTMIYVNDWEK